MLQLRLVLKRIRKLMSLRRGIMLCMEATGGVLRHPTKLQVCERKRSKETSAPRENCKQKLLFMWFKRSPWIEAEIGIVIYMVLTLVVWMMQDWRSPNSTTVSESYWNQVDTLREHCIKPRRNGSLGHVGTPQNFKEFYITILS